MKKNSEPLSLEQLLASVEHAGRDSRRQQQLSAMIERMADDEAKKRRTFRMWAVPLAAAATVTLFVITSVWQWEDPMQPAGPQLAQAPAEPKTSERSRSFFSFFHAEPSMMDGTVLAFNIL